MSEELKPCPFCGEEAKLYDNQEHPYIYRVACTDCKTAYGYSYSYSEKQTAISTWNQRIPDWEYNHKRLMSELTECREHNKRLNALFNSQRTRSQQADKLWQEATGKYDTIPDLGVLLEWLMGETENAKGACSAKGACMKAALSRLSIARAEIKTLEKRIDDWRGECNIESTRGMEWKERAEIAEGELKKCRADSELQYKRFLIAHEEALKQRRHRKWVLKKAREGVAYLVWAGSWERT